MMDEFNKEVSVMRKEKKPPQPPIHPLVEREITAEKVVGKQAQGES